MSTYVLIQFDRAAPEVVQAYGPLAGQSVQESQGNVVISPAVQTSLEGDPLRERVVLLKFGSTEAAHAWYESETYRQARATRGDKMNMVMTLLEQS